MEELSRLAAEEERDGENVETVAGLTRGVSKLNRLTDKLLTKNRRRTAERKHGGATAEREANEDRVSKRFPLGQINSISSSISSVPPVSSSEQHVRSHVGTGQQERVPEAHVQEGNSQSGESRRGCSPAVS